MDYDTIREQVPAAAEIARLAAESIVKRTEQEGRSAKQFDADSFHSLLCMAQQLSDLARLSDHSDLWGAAEVERFYRSLASYLGNVAAHALIQIATLPVEMRLPEGDLSTHVQHYEEPVQ